MYEYKTKDKRRHLYQIINTITVQLQKFRLQNEVESSGFLSKSAEHIVWRRTVLAVALQQEKHF